MSLYVLIVINAHTTAQEKNIKESFKFELTKETPANKKNTIATINNPSFHLFNMIPPI